MAIKKYSLILLGSGKGSTIKSLCEAVKSGNLQAEIKALITDNPRSNILSLAEEYKIPSFTLPFEKSQEEKWDKELLKILKKYHPDLILLAGFLRKIGPQVLSAFKNRILNSHPALLPDFGGEGMYGLKVHKAVIESQREKTGVTVHIVDKNYDTGPILVQEEMDVRPKETPSALQERVKLIEKRIYKESLQKIISGELPLPRSFKEMGLLFLKGGVLGLSTILPGVSGGTAAFILGLYEKLIHEISKIKPAHFLTFPLKKNHPFIKDYDWVFLISLVLGALFAIVTFAFAATPFIKAHPELFEFLVFVLVLVSLYFPLRDIKKTTKVLGLAGGSALVSFIFFYALKDVALFSETGSPLWLFPAGGLAGLALVVPGLSGSYLLVLFGLYESVLEAVKNFHVLPLCLFAAGVFSGGIAMARMMKNFLKKHFHETSGVIVGLILGSLCLLLPF